MISLYRLLAYGSTWCHANRTSSSSTGVDLGGIGNHLGRLDLQCGQRAAEVPQGRIGVAAARDERADDLSVLVDRSVHVSADSVDLDVDLVNVPPIAGRVPAKPGGVGQQRG